MPHHPSFQAGDLVRCIDADGIAQLSHIVTENPGFIFCVLQDMSPGSPMVQVHMRPGERRVNFFYWRFELIERNQNRKVLGSGTKHKIGVPKGPLP